MTAAWAAWRQLAFQGPSPQTWSSWFPKGGKGGKCGKGGKGRKGGKGKGGKGGKGLGALDPAQFPALGAMDWSWGGYLAAVTAPEPRLQCTPALAGQQAMS